MVKGICTPARIDTTSEPQGRNALPGAPVTASMSDGLMTVTRVEPWNTLYPTPVLSGDGIIFLPSPRQGNVKFKMHNAK